MSNQINYWTIKTLEKKGIPVSETETVEDNIAVTEQAAEGALINSVSLSDSSKVNDILSSVQMSEASVDVTKEKKKLSLPVRILKILFLGIIIGIPLFVIFMVLITAGVVVSAVLMGGFAALTVAFMVGAILLIIYAFSELGSSPDITLFFIASGFLFIGFSFFSFLLSRISLIYLLKKVVKLYVKPARMLKSFFL